MREEKMKIVIASALFLVLVIVIPIICIPYIEKLSQPEVQLQFKQWASENKFYGIMALLGISNMKLGKFIVLSAFARIPSIISSTIIGATMIEGRWRFSIALFVITGTIGIAGIWIEDRIVSRFKKNSHADIRMSKSECMDIVEASHQKELYPLIFCHLQMKGLLDIENFTSMILNREYL